MTKVNPDEQSHLHVKFGDLVNVLDIKNGKHVHILPFDNSIEGLSGKTFDVYLKPYFLKGMPIALFFDMHSSCWLYIPAYRPVHKSDTFLVRDDMHTVEFKVIGTNPSEFCIVAQDTVIHTGRPYQFHMNIWLRYWL